MKIDVVTLFPDYLTGPLGQSMMRKASESGLVEFGVHDLRQWGIGKRRTVDGIPYGGGAGMVLRPEPLFRAFTELQSPDMHRIYLTPQGKRFEQSDAERLAKHKHLILLAGRYEGVDGRVRDRLVDEELSIGDYVLTGGELPALVVIDAVVRHVPGVLGDERSSQEETFSEPLGGGLEYPHYTRPEIFKDPQTGKQLKVPDVLLTGHHADIEKWRKEQSKAATRSRRPDLT
ncbi:MAG TPA: tRNA (guanosine(37)-N1)-methyltransferase TrmD [Patescibacteria group bacterium]|jgi:tRNA (guanine37-N1)-methyltransferase